MAQYFVFLNQSKNRQANEPGSREEMACDIFNCISMERRPKDYFLAFESDTPGATLELLKCELIGSLQIDDARASHWVDELQPMVSLAYKVDDAISTAYTAMTESMMEFNNVAKRSGYSKSLALLPIKHVEHTFDNLEISPLYDVAFVVAQVFEYQFLQEKSIET